MNRAISPIELKPDLYILEKNILEVEKILVLQQTSPRQESDWHDLEKKDILEVQEILALQEPGPPQKVQDFLKAESENRCASTISVPECECGCGDNGNCTNAKYYQQEANGYDLLKESRSYYANEEPKTKAARLEKMSFR
jgi:hypothetical protein